MLKGFGKARIPIAEEQARNLADFVKNLTKDVGTMMNGFKKEHKEMSEELKGRLVKEVKEIETYVTKLLKEFRASRSDPRVSEAYRKNFDKYIRGIISSVRGIANNTKQLIGEYHSDMSKARHAWQGMTATLARAKGKGALTKIETGEKVATVAEATEKKRRNRKRGRKRP
jgi:Sec-independent protein translocase protein TatA